MFKWCQFVGSCYHLKGLKKSIWFMNHGDNFPIYLTNGSNSYHMTYIIQILIFKFFFNFIFMQSFWKFCRVIFLCGINKASICLFIYNFQHLSKFSYDPYTYQLQADDRRPSQLLNKAMYHRSENESELDGYQKNKQFPTLAYYPIICLILAQCTVTLGFVVDLQDQHSQYQSQNTANAYSPNAYRTSLIA